MKNSITLIVILLILFSLSCERDITSHSSIMSIQISDYLLPGYFVTALSFDSREAAWIGTFKQGLIKYDGSATFYNSTNSSLPDSIIIWDIAVDKTDNVWIASDVGLIKYDNDDFNVYNTSNSPIPEDIVWSIAVDQNNVLWFACCRFRQGGLVKFDGKKWTVYTPENSAMPFHSVRDVAVDGRNNVWLTMSETIGSACVIKISGDNWKIYDEDDFGFAPYYFRDLTVDKENNIYASLDYGLSSCYDVTRPNIVEYDGSGWRVNNPADENGESLGYVGKMATDLHGHLWASLYSKKGASLAFYNGIKWIYNNPDVPLDWSSEIAVDQSNTVWVGTGSGIYLIK